MKPSRKMLTAIKRYQVPGACNEFNPKTARIDAYGWAEHVPGTAIGGLGFFFLGMPKGFNRIGPMPVDCIRLRIFESFEDNWSYGKFNVPVWKYLDEFGNTLVRGLSPRVNVPFLHVILGDHRSKIDCREITDTDLESMD